MKMPGSEADVAIQKEMYETLMRILKDIKQLLLVMHLIVKEIKQVQEK